MAGGPIGIAGGGIGGLTLAVALQRQDVEVTVFERHHELSELGAGISLWPNALAALDAAGAGDDVRRLGMEVDTGGLMRADGSGAAAVPAGPARRVLGGSLVCVHRAELVELLASQLGPGTVRTSSSVTGYRRRGAGVEILLGEEDPVEVAGLVGADGIASTIASQLARGDLIFSYSGYTAWRAVAPIGVDESPPTSWIAWAPEHEFGRVPMDPDRTYWFATAMVPERHRFPVGETSYLADTFADWSAPVPKLVASTPPEALVRHDIVDRTGPARWSDGPVTLLGDAAHPMRPHLGQGGCQAIEDAVCLANHIGTATSLPAAFVAYEHRRRRRVRNVVRISRRAGLTMAQGWRTNLMAKTAGSGGVLAGVGLRALAPIVGYSAGARAVAVSSHLQSH